ncbi:hypothetical protein Tcan_00181 [Toxocara canis]|uniref:Uncharacterized protein n=1 Tax=Toxocara canis TaxID=6265 RepID=A0A0B2V5G8_TOXCA|nr:hypothetical protein Tcan_00181 [Toxocara canis]
MKDPERSAESTVFSWIIDLKEFAYVGDEKLRLSDAKVQFVNLYNNTLHFYCNDGYDRSLHLSKGDVSVSYVCFFSYAIYLTRPNHKVLAQTSEFLSLLNLPN